MEVFQKYFKDQNGNFGTMFAVLLVPLIIGIGAAVDISRAASYKTKLQDSADAAALNAAVAYVKEGTREMRVEGRDTFAYHADTIENLTYTRPEIRKTNQNSVAVSSSGSVSSLFPQIFGHPKLEFDVESEAIIAEPEGLEITIAFDNTNSMNFGTHWQTSITTIRNTLEDMQSFSGRNNFYLTLVPFADTVNIGASNAGWTSGSIPSGWAGCVQPRKPLLGIPDDKSPSSEPFAPTPPGQQYEADSETVACPVVEITGPTNSIDDVIDATSLMTPGGTGRFDVGLAWAWRTLSTQWRGEWGVSNYPATNSSNIPSENRKKKIIFLTDGLSDASSRDHSERSWAFNQGSESYFERFVDLCDMVKSDGIEIYIVDIAANPHAVDYFKQCATTLNHYYSVDGISDLKLPITDIRNELFSELRIVR